MMNPAGNLRYDVFVNDPPPQDGLLPNGEPKRFSPTASTLIYGAGAGGAMVLREVRSNDDLDWTIIGFIDDDRGKYQTNVNGVPVLGSLEQVATLLASGQVAQVVVTTSAVPHERLDRAAVSQPTHRRARHARVGRRCGRRGVSGQVGAGHLVVPLTFESQVLADGEPESRSFA